jgi:hypothetical protein
MDMTVELTVEYTRSETTIDDPKPFKLKAEVIQNAFIEREIYLFLRTIKPGCEAVDTFCALCGPTEMVSLPADEPLPGIPGFRKAILELEFANGVGREDVIAQLRHDTEKLVDDYQVSSQHVPPTFQEQYLGG